MKFLVVLLFISATALADDETENSDVSASSSICSSPVKSSDNCVTVKFPWKDDEVYFCPDTDYNYRKEEKLDEYQCTEALGSDYMMVDAAWLDCPKIMETDSCSWYNYYDLCYEAPYNRPECKDVSEESACCPEYYCGPGETWDDCATMECPEPPSDAYTEFYDYYSCCPSYQLVQDEKPGKCPIQEEYDYDYYTYDDDDFWYKKRSTEKRSAEKRSTYEDCVGDFNCPGEKKCCAYYGDYGYCTEPEAEEVTDEPAVEEGSQSESSNETSSQESTNENESTE